MCGKLLWQFCYPLAVQHMIPPLPDKCFAEEMRTQNKDSNVIEEQDYFAVCWGSLKTVKTLKQEINTHKQMLQTDKDSSTKTLRKE